MSTDPTPASEPRAFSNPVMAIVVVVTALAVGFVSGVAADRFMLKRDGTSGIGGGGWGGVKKGGASASSQMLDGMDRELDLTDAQRKQVEEIMKKHFSQGDLAAGGRKRFRQEIDQANQEINAILTPEQRPKYEAMRQRMREKMKKKK